MGINGLENDYYLSGNDIWIKVVDVDYEDKYPVRLDVSILNEYTGFNIPALKMYPTISRNFHFNISLPIRALQPEPDHVAPNKTIGRYKITFMVTYSDDSTETMELNKYFLRGGRSKKGNQDWYLDSSYPLIVEKWVEWSGVTLPGNAYRIQGGEIVEFSPSGNMVYNNYLPGNCNPMIVKFLNSLGGYQFFVFEYHERQVSTKGRGAVALIADALRFNTSRSLGIEDEEIITLKSKTPEEIQPIFLDLIRSLDVYIFDPSGIDEYGKWERVEISESNKGVLNSLSRSYMNEVSFKIPNYITREL